ncbi:MAG: competence/damage-inducible protein A [Verrucomicrobiaceae bacterium]|nr:competence/damage-inducible protein A [Verrucomicrobiaceae bacterium]
MQVEVINTGTELLLGQVTNTHVGFFGERLLEIGLRISRQGTVPDGDDIKDMLAGAIERSRIILVTGGLGPTSDDLTREMTAEFLGLELVEDGGVMAKIASRFRASGNEMRPSNQRQAMVPEGAEVLDNNNGTAPGLYLSTGIGSSRVHIFLLPGPPRELYPIFEEQVLPRIKNVLESEGLGVPVARNYFFMGVGESELAGRVELVMDGIPGDFEIGYCLKAGGVIVRCICSERYVAGLDEAIRGIAPEDLVAEGASAIEDVVVRDLSAAGERVAIAESCTGGLIANRITNVPGASRVFDVGYITYANEAKRRLLGVSEAMINEMGVVSETVAKAMAEGCLESSGSDHAISVTGIAGPTGGSSKKPVGSVWIGLASSGVAARAFYYRFKTDRMHFKDRASTVAIDLLRRRLGGWL